MLVEGCLTLGSEVFLGLDTTAVPETRRNPKGSFVETPFEGVICRDYVGSLLKDSMGSCLTGY